MAALIGGNIRMIRKKAMECLILQVEIDTLGNGLTVSVMDTEFSDYRMEKHIRDDGKMVKRRATHIRDQLKAMNTMDSIRSVCDSERKYNYRTATNQTKSFKSKRKRIIIRQNTC
jgi:hypothetical protein